MLESTDDWSVENNHAFAFFGIVGIEWIFSKNWSFSGSELENTVLLYKNYPSNITVVSEGLQKYMHIFRKLCLK